MNDLQESRRRFDALLKGRYAPRPISPEEAKLRLRQTDPGIDISEFLAALSQKDLRRAGNALVWQTLAPETIAYFTPLIVGAIQSFVAANAAKESEKS